MLSAYCKYDRDFLFSNSNPVIVAAPFLFGIKVKKVVFKLVAI